MDQFDGPMHITKLGHGPSDVWLVKFEPDPALTWTSGPMGWPIFNFFYNFLIDFF